MAGTVAMTSRDSEVTIGVIMKARMMPAVKNEAPLVGAPNRESSTGMPVTPEAIEAVDVLDPGREDQDPPQAPDHGRDHGQQVDHVDDRA